MVDWNTNRIRQTLAVARQELKNMVREKSLILIVFLELILLTSSGMVALGYEFLTSPSESDFAGFLGGFVYLGFVSPDRGELVSAARDAGVRYVFYDSAQNAVEQMRGGRVDAIVIGTLDQDNPPARLTVILTGNNPNQAWIRMSLKRFFNHLESGMREDIIDSRELDVQLIDYQLPRRRIRSLPEVYLVFTLPLLLFMPALIAGNLVMDSLTQEIESKRILNLLSAPLSFTQVFYGKALASLLVTQLQVLLWILVMNHFIIQVSNKILLILVTCLYSLFYIHAGGLFSLWFGKMRPTQSIYTLLILFSMVLLTPFASAHELLLTLSPSFILTHIASGMGLKSFTPQISLMSALTIILALLVQVFKQKIKDY